MKFQPPSSAIVRRQALCGAVLACLSAFTLYAAYWLQNERGDGLPPIYWDLFWQTLPVFITVKVLIFAVTGQLQWSRFVTFHDLIGLLKAATLSTIIIVVLNYLAAVTLDVPRGIVLMDWGLTVLATGGLRMLVRMIEERQPTLLQAAGQTPVLIVGANTSGEILLRTIRRHRNLAYRVVGFIAESQSEAHRRIGGVRVVGNLDNAIDVALRNSVTQLLITAGDLEGEQVRDLVERGKRQNIAIRVLPRMDQLLDDRVNLRPRDVSIEDLLRRDPVQLNMESIHQWLDGKVVLVTGSAGSIGSEISRQLAKLPLQKLLLADRSENGQFYLDRELCQLDDIGCPYETCIADVTDGLRMSQIFQQHQVDIVFHAAAYKHVPLMEAYPGEAVKNIVLASRMLANLAHQHKIESFVMVSTDKAVNPTSVMGACKRTAELHVQALADQSDTRFVTVRFGNVLGSAGSVIPVFKKQIEQGGPVTVTHPDMTRFFMTIPEASQLVIQAGAMGKGGEIFVLDMGKPVKIVDLAKDLIQLSGLEEGKDIRIEFVGMRPGEKLYEELHVEGEVHLATSHPKIMVAQADHCGLPAMRGHISELSDATEFDGDSVRRKLLDVVPQYQWTDETPQRRAA